jgi:hypothetical protein
MRVGIISEGRSDAAVLTNILKGQLNIDRSNISYLGPELEYDETTLHQMRLEQYSNWTIVKQNCENRDKISDFFDFFDDDRFLIVHIDSDMRNEIGFEVREPSEIKTIDDICLLRQNVIKKLEEWLNHQYMGKIIFAIAIQEIDSWILAIHSNKETGFSPNAKERLNRFFNGPSLSKKERQKIYALETNKLEQYELLSSDFRKKNKLNSIATNNISLKLFIDDLSLKSS